MPKQSIDASLAFRTASESLRVIDMYIRTSRVMPIRMAQRLTPDTILHTPWRRVERSLFSAPYFLHRRSLLPIYPPDR